jgi:hypothetical protein
VHGLFKHLVPDPQQIENVEGGDFSLPGSSEPDACRMIQRSCLFMFLQESDTVNPFPTEKYQGRKHETGTTKHDRAGAVTLFVGNLPFSVTEEKLR